MKWLSILHQYILFIKEYYYLNHWQFFKINWNPFRKSIDSISRSKLVNNGYLCMLYVWWYGWCDLKSKMLVLCSVFCSLASCFVVIVDGRSIRRYRFTWLGYFGSLRFWENRKKMCYDRWWDRLFQVTYLTGASYLSTDAEFLDKVIWVHLYRLIFCKNFNTVICIAMLS